MFSYLQMTWMYQSSLNVTYVKNSYFFLYFVFFFVFWLFLDTENSQISTEDRQNINSDNSLENISEVNSSLLETGSQKQKRSHEKSTKLHVFSHGCEYYHWV